MVSFYNFIVITELNGGGPRGNA